MLFNCNISIQLLFICREIILVVKFVTMSNVEVSEAWFSKLKLIFSYICQKNQKITSGMSKLLENIQ